MRRALPQIILSLGLGLSQLTLLERTPRSGAELARDGASGDPEREEGVERCGEERARGELLLVGRSTEGDGDKVVMVWPGRRMK